MRHFLSLLDVSADGAAGAAGRGRPAEGGPEAGPPPAAAGRAGAGPGLREAVAAHARRASRRRWRNWAARASSSAPPTGPWASARACPTSPARCRATSMPSLLRTFKHATDRGVRRPLERAGDQRPVRPVPPLPGAGRPADDPGGVRRAGGQDAGVRRRRQQRGPVRGDRLRAVRAALHPGGPGGLRLRRAVPEGAIDDWRRGASCWSTAGPNTRSARRT